MNDVIAENRFVDTIKKTCKLGPYPEPERDSARLAI